MIETDPVFVEVECAFCRTATRHLVASNAHDVLPDATLRFLGPDVRLHPVHTCVRCGNSYLDADYG